MGRPRKKPRIYKQITLSECGDLLTIEEVSGLLHIDQEKVKVMYRTGMLPGFHIGKPWYITKEDLLSVINSKRLEAKGC